MLFTYKEAGKVVGVGGIGGEGSGEVNRTVCCTTRARGQEPRTGRREEGEVGTDRGGERERWETYRQRERKRETEWGDGKRERDEGRQRERGQERDGERGRDGEE